jgi:hypothetical protein
MAMMALMIGAPTDYMQQLEEHARIVKLPRVGVDENVAFPAVQANIAPAVALDDALGILNHNGDISHHLLTPSFRKGS